MKKIEENEKKGLTFRETSGILTKLSARNGLPAKAVVGKTEKTFEKLEKSA